MKKTHDIQSQQKDIAHDAPVSHYEENFKADSSYRQTLPDIQNASKDTIRGANVPIMQVGVHNFKLPLKFLTHTCEVRELQASITSTVSLAADNKGINMSRIMRVFYMFADRIFTPDTLEEVLIKMKEQLATSRARIKISFEYPIQQKSLRSNHTAWQYYKCAYEGFIDDLDIFRKIVHFDFVYSSACPCSAELSEHARRTRNVYCVPHSQRSKARVSAEIEKSAHISIEDMHSLCLEALRTETQTMVRREDEQAFAELNGAYAKFIEDATRLLYQEFDAEKRIKDFEIACIHLESLHSHDAVGVICKGKPGGFTGSFSNFHDLIC
ncbi:MAG: GTP cyclohydrolase I FolE2 [Opitutales bacterium]|nr:GTP cyclohydrolase I FolE2 [Opitutales bacterium]MBQ2721762.1 GTP cyclohydrolase I FolE2 [Opitutales bacterium]